MAEAEWFGRLRSHLKSLEVQQVTMLRTWKEQRTSPMSVDVCQPFFVEIPLGHSDVEFIREMQSMILEDRNALQVERRCEGYRLGRGDLSRTLIRKRGADELDGTAEKELQPSSWKRQKWDDGGLLKMMLTEADGIQTSVVRKTGIDVTGTNVDVSDLLEELLDAGQDIV